MYIILSILAGKPLDSVLTDITTYLPQVQELGREEQALHIQIYFQSRHCLMGLADNPTEMTGHAIPDAKAFECEIRSLESKTSLVIYQVLQTFLCSIFGEHERGAQLALDRGDAFFQVTAGCPQAMIDTFHRGVSLFDMARRTKKKKYKRAAKKTLSTMRKWSKQDNPNIVHTLTLLEAEQLVLKGDEKNASVKYEKSVTLSIRQGMLQDAAFACERYGEYLLNEIKDEDKAMHYLRKSIGYYKDWGALAKVEQMNGKYTCWKVPHNIEISQ